jgi:diacylglycerol O-acyltransferase / wax synthase
MADARPQREQHFKRRMSDFEALMWNVEKDPRLNPNGCSLQILEGPIDLEHFQSHVAAAVAGVPRLRERVTPTLGRLSPPVWRADPEFDLSFHIRPLALPRPGRMRQLLDLVSTLYQDPYDRTRPLWVFYVIDGLDHDRSALLWKFHHAITDGIGAGRLAEHWMQRTADAPPADPVDISALAQEALAAETREDALPLALFEGLARTATHTMRRQLGIWRRAAGELALWGADPLRAWDLLAEGLGLVQYSRKQLFGEGRPEDGELDSGAPLWRRRSRHRTAEVLEVPLSRAKAAAKVLGGSVNDFFVTGAVTAAVAYHDRRGVAVDSLNLSFVVSTRTDRGLGGNAFTPTRLRVPGGKMELDQRFRVVSERMAAKRAEVRGQGVFSALSGVANLLPTSIVAGLARSQAAKQDFATSNLRGPTTPWYISGAKVLRAYPFGPVAGTAFNLTTQSYLDSLDMGLLVDPAAVDASEMRMLLEESYADLLRVGGIVD